MRFKCGNTLEEYRTKRDLYEKKMFNKYDGIWKSWFAWYPVSIEMGKCAWLETIERKRDFYPGLDFVITEYRFKPH